MTEADRPNPDELLAAVNRDEARRRRGRLRIFFGAAAGVGKTYSMLEAAQQARRAGVPVVVGYVEPHGRADTARLLEGLECLPPLQVSQRGVVRAEFDLDAALARRPATLLVDELAHSNLVDGEPRPRHRKRWQDVEELLDAGIDVWTTLNVQHLESLNDLVAGITGVRQQETLPDHIFDHATDVELIDLPPHDLLERLRAGKVYAEPQARLAMERFFRLPNLIALRELALRRTADRVDAAAQEYVGIAGSSRPWLARDRFMVAVAPDEQADHLVRFGKRFADALDAEWIVVSVETPPLLRLGERGRDRRVAVLRLAESLGAETVTLSGSSAAAALLDYARLRGVTRIVVGEPRRSGLWHRLRSSTAIDLVRDAAGVDVSVIARSTDRPPPSPTGGVGTARTVPWRRYGAALLVSALSTGLAALMYPAFELTNLVMVYLLGTTIAALRLGRGPASVAAVANVAAFDYCFVPPRFSFAVSDLQYLVTFAVMLAVALTIASLVSAVRAQTRVAGARERRTALLYAMSRELAATRGWDSLSRIAIRHVAEGFACDVALLAPDRAGRLAWTPDAQARGELADPDVSIAQWVYDHDRPAGLGTDTLPATAAQYLPLRGTHQVFGVLAVRPTHPRRILLPEQRHLLATFAGQIAMALERSQLADEAAAARTASATEHLRNTLLASISHDLRTPLAVITGASSALNDATLRLEETARASLTQAIEQKAREMSELISNVLDLMRFEAGGVALRRDWQTIEDLVGAALRRLDGRLADWPVEVALPGELPAVFVDGSLVTQVLTNLLENAARHTPAGSAITVTASGDRGWVEVVVQDTGPGLPPGDPERLFAKFQRGRNEGTTGGAGLGLAICRAIVEAHGGRISAIDRPGGGARFTFTLPATEAPP